MKAEPSFGFCSDYFTELCFWLSCVGGYGALKICEPLYLLFDRLPYTVYGVFIYCKENECLHSNYTDGDR